MTKAEKAARIGVMLDELYPEPPIPLDHVDPFTLLVAVMLSAQTTDKKVNEVTPALFARAPTPAAMAALEVDEIRELIREIGLAPTKAKNLKRTAELLVERHGGEVPPTLDELEALPGVGHKTAQVVQAQAFEIPAFPVDTHIHRLAARWGLSRAKNVDETERDLKALFPEDTWIRRHLQIIYFGREHCPARGHDLSTCPICSWAASKERIAAEAPTKKSASAAVGATPKRRAAATARSTKRPRAPRD
ncbi:MAG: endonuclease III [Myxococcales bacterium]|nr:endonuclease III [Myxococcales bacterium]